MPRAVKQAIPLTRPRTSILKKAIRQSFLLAAGAVTILTLIGFLVARSLLLQMEEEAAAQSIKAIGITFVTVDVLVFLLAASLAYFLSKDLTGALRKLAHSVATLGPGTWSFEQHVRSGDEVELLDRVIGDLASRLKHIYEHLEEEVKQRTEELRIQSAIDRGILEGIQQGILLTDQEGRLTQANPAALTLLERKPSDVIGASAASLIDIRAHHGERLTGVHPVPQCLQTKEMMHSDPVAHVTLARPDGTLLPILYVVTPFFEGEILAGSIIVIQDMTEERQIDYMKSDFITLASHQLRTPLSTLRWYLDLFFEEKSLNDVQQSYLKEMQQSLERMVNLLNALLHAARMEGEGSAPHQQMVDVTAVASEMVDAVGDQAKNAGVACSATLPSHPVQICTDPSLLRIVLQNLLSNALKYTRGGKEVTVTVAERPDMIEIQVADGGIGIPTAEQKRVFQKFFRAQNVRTLDTDGNGLGLYITKSMIERLGGTISFTSTEGRGTTFIIQLPLCPDTKECKLPQKEAEN